jgi:RimJ/RimL family protein N-acetyltransferase
VEVPQTPRLVLREMADADLEDMAALLGDPDVMRYYPRPMSRAEAGAWIEWNLRNYQAHGFGLWIMHLRQTGEFVGDCGITLQRVDGRDEPEVGYHVRASMQGRGLATEATSAVRDFARDILGLRRLIAIIDPANAPSRRVAEKIGMTIEKHAAAPNGTPALIYSARVERPPRSQHQGRAAR